MEYFKIGKITGIHGVSGKLVLKHSLGDEKDLGKIKTVFTEEKSESFIPWFVKSVHKKNHSEIYIELEEITAKETARPFLKKDIWLEANAFQETVSRSSPISLLNYDIVEHDKIMGTIIEVVEQPYQTLCRILVMGKDVWIPIHGKTLLEIDHENKRVVVELPTGLLDTYLH